MKELSDMHKLNDKEVRSAFRFILGREPESQATIEAHQKLGSWQELREVLLQSREFADIIKERHRTNTNTDITKSRWTSVDVLGCYTQWVDTHDQFVSLGCRHNNWEPNETKFFMSKLKKGDIVLDIGANIGWFTLIAARQLQNTGHIHSFEPRPETLHYLRRTTTDNKLNDIVTVWPYALSDTNAQQRLMWGINTINPGGAHLEGNCHTNYGNCESALVELRRLDDLLPDVAPDIIKIDVEGAEPLVIAGAVNAINRKKPIILSELHSRQLAVVSGVTPKQYIEQMADLGYKCYVLRNGNLADNILDFPETSGVDVVSVVFQFEG